MSESNDDDDDSCNVFCMLGLDHHHQQQQQQDRPPETPVYALFQFIVLSVFHSFTNVSKTVPAKVP